MTKTLTTTNAIPERISAEHYQMLSSKGDRSYDLVFVADRGRWLCNCPDTRRNFNDNCKHRRRLVAWIAEQSQSQREATQIAAGREQAPVAQPITDTTIYGMMEALMEAEITIKKQGDRIDCLEYDVRAINQVAQATISEQDHKIDLLEQMLSQIVSQVALLQADLQAVKAAKAPASREAAATKRPPTQEELDKAEWEEFERDPVAYKAKKKRESATLHGSKPFNLES